MNSLSKTFQKIVPGPLQRYSGRIAPVIRTNLRIDQARESVGPIGNLIRGTTWIVAEWLSGDKLPR
ncbi:MAG: hypothetical protein HHAS10_05480 [Candidatus Altimarinota bacterium]